VKASERETETDRETEMKTETDREAQRQRGEYTDTKTSERSK